MGNRIYGCDDCLAVCPWNKFAQIAREEPDFSPRAATTAPRLAELAAARRRGIPRDVRRLAGQAHRPRPLRPQRPHRDRQRASGAPGLLAAARRGLDDASPLVRAMAVWAIARLAPAQCAAERVGRLIREEDALVRTEWEREISGLAKG